MLSSPRCIFVVGGPGCGKGTTCEKLARDPTKFHLNGKLVTFVHLCAGDLLRSVASGDSPCSNIEIKDKVQYLLSNGKIVPSEITFALISEALRANEKNGACGTQRIYLLDGYPRKRDQGDWFEKEFGRVSKVIYLNCSSSTLRKRLLKRQSKDVQNQSVSTPRKDDIPSLIDKRIQVHVEECLPVIESYSAENRLHTIDCDDKTVEQVVDETRLAILSLTR